MGPFPLARPVLTLLICGIMDRLHGGSFDKSILDDFFISSDFFPTIFFSIVLLTSLTLFVHGNPYIRHVNSSSSFTKLSVTTHSMPTFLNVGWCFAFFINFLGEALYLSPEMHCWHLLQCICRSQEVYGKMILPNHLHVH